MYLNELQTRVYFQHERSLERSLEKLRLRDERRATAGARTQRGRRPLARRR